MYRMVAPSIPLAAGLSGPGSGRIGFCRPGWGGLAFQGVVVVMGPPVSRVAEREQEGGALAGGRLRPYPAMMGLHYAADQGEADARALGGRVQFLEKIEDAMQ